MCLETLEVRMISVQSNQAISSSKLPYYILETIADSKANSKQLVLVTGVFDVLHSEHINFLNKSKELGNVLMIGVESDSRVKALKGCQRPINSQEVRLKNLLKLKITNNIFILPDDFDKPEDHLKLIQTIMPKYLAVSSHTAHLVEKRRIMNLVDGELAIIHQQNPEVSSTKIINGDC